MKLILLIFSAVCSCSIINAQDIPELEKQKYSAIHRVKDLNYPGDTSFDVLYYKLDLNISLQPDYLQGAVTVSASSLNDQLDSIFLDLSRNLIVDSIESPGSIKLNFSHTGDKLFIKLPRIFSSNEKFEVTIFYRGVPQPTGFRSFVFDSHNGQPSIWSLSEPYGSRDWWPCKDTPADKADSSEVWITCPSGLIAVSNGNLADEFTNNDNTRTYKWKSSYPIANYLISIAVSNYTVYRDYFVYETAGGIKDSMPVVHYIYPEAFEEWKSQLDKTPYMLRVFSDIFGPYPFLREKYGHAQFGGGGMEHQTVSSMVEFNDRIMLHEAAHQWFGDKVTCRDWENIWLNEGFATYAEALFTEVNTGRAEYDTYVNLQMNAAKNAEGSIYVRDISSVSEIFNGARTYNKGAVVLHMLRGITGSPVFFDILKEYLNHPQLAYSTAVTGDFQAVAENVSGMDLDYFFSEWIYGENYPEYSIVWNYERTGTNLYKIDFKIEQQINTSPEFFTMPVQIEIRTENGDTLFTVFNNQLIQDFTIYLTGEPIEFTFDPGNLILKEVFINDPLELINTMRLEQNYPNPFNASTRIKYRIGETSQVTIKITNILGEEVATLVNEERTAGRYEVLLDQDITGRLASGIYFYKLYAENRLRTFSDIKKMILIK